MRRVVLQPTELFTSSFINRTGAFNARALAAATDIIEQVRARGDEALRDLTEKFDGVRPTTFRVPQETIDAAVDAVDPDTLAALKHAAHFAQERAAVIISGNNSAPPWLWKCREDGSR